MSSSRPRYAAKVEKGENAWKREWSSFISGVNLQRLREGRSGAALKASADLQHHLSDETAGDGAATSTFGYLFSSPSERKAVRHAKAQEQREDELQKRRSSKDPLAHLSKHQRTLLEAEKRGLKLEGMTRKEKRDFLHLTVSEAQQEAQQRSQTFKLHELMDEKLAWYQQGPSPIDIVSEKLVTRKAEKKGRQLGLRYNYLLPHPSWIAKRVQHRKESLRVGLGRRFVFDEDGVAMDPLRGTVVDITKTNLLLCAADGAGPTAREAAVSADTAAPRDPSAATSAPPAQTKPTTATTPSSALADILAHPHAASKNYVRSVVKDRAAALAIAQANLSTAFLSKEIVKGPSIGIEEEHGNPTSMLPPAAAAASRPVAGPPYTNRERAPRAKSARKASPSALASEPLTKKKRRVEHK